MPQAEDSAEKYYLKQTKNLVTLHKKTFILLNLFLTSQS